MSSSPAVTLISEDELKKVINGDRLFKHRQKLLGLIPKGKDSAFGDFPRLRSSSVSGGNFLTIRPKRILSHLQGIPPPSTGIFSPAPIQPTQFRRFYLRGDLPISIQHGTPNTVGWKVDIKSLSYSDYLPLFLEGLREKEDPYRFMAVQGSHDLISHAEETQVLEVIPQLIIPTKAALDTRDPEVIVTVCKLLQAMLMIGGGSRAIGEALVPFYRQLMPTMSIYKSCNINIGDKIDYDQRKRHCLGDLIYETLNMMEELGGQDAFINIKYMIPTYESIFKFSQ